MKTLRGKQVLVTGAASGIGLEAARAFARQGANLVVSDLNGTALEGIRREITAMGVGCLAQPCDVGCEASVAAFADAVQSAVGPVDVLVNNAGIGYLGSFEQTPVAWWRHTFDVNVLGIVHLIQAFLPAMRAAGGERKIVNVASLAGVAPAPNMAAYAASKHAVIGLSEVLALELHDSPVSVLVVCPGIINTNIVNVPGRTTAAIGAAQLEKLRRYYVEHGCLPGLVGDGIVRSVLNDDLYLFVGPEAKPAAALARLSRRLTRWMTIRAARKSGYLAEA
jgi:NAD(P)-dependent dehydrogenase (short-subunit alcohol dehydrogenase family)